MKYVELDISLEVDLVKNPDTGKYVPFEWRDVVGYEGYYQVSNYGNIKSLDRYIEYNNRGGRIHKGKLLTPQKNNSGYMQIGLRKDKISKRYSVHRLVAEAFISNPENKRCINHINSVKTDNKKINLEWNTHRENTQHAINSGAFVLRNNSKLSEDEVIEIAYLIDEGELKFQDIADKFNISKSTVGKINTGDSWNNVTGRKGKVQPSDLKGSNNPRAKSIVNCKGEVFNLMKDAALKYSISQSGLTRACKEGLTSGKYLDGTPIKWYYKEEKAEK